MSRAKATEKLDRAVARARATLEAFPKALTEWGFRAAIQRYGGDAAHAEAKLAELLPAQRAFETTASDDALAVMLREEAERLAALVLGTYSTARGAWHGCSTSEMANLLSRHELDAKMDVRHLLLELADELAG